MGAYADSVDGVRLLVGDTGDEPVFEDSQYEMFLELTGGSYYRAAARALYAIAANHAYTLKVITILDVKTDGKATAEGIIEAAKAYDDLADAEEANTIVCGTANTILPRLTTHLRPWWESL